MRRLQKAHGKNRIWIWCVFAMNIWRLLLASDTFMHLQVYDVMCLCTYNVYISQTLRNLRSQGVITQTTCPPIRCWLSHMGRPLAPENSISTSLPISQSHLSIKQLSFRNSDFLLFILDPLFICRSSLSPSIIRQKDPWEQGSWATLICFPLVYSASVQCFV